MAYIYEYIRTRGTKPLHFEEHYARLEELSRSVFMLPLATSREEMKRMITSKLKSAGYTSTATNAVCVKIDPLSDSPHIEIEEIMYDTFALRAIRPQGVPFSVGQNTISENTSAREALIEFNRTTSHVTDEGVAVWINEDDEVVAIDGASVIAVFEDEIRFSGRCLGFESELAYQILSEKANNVTRGTIHRSEVATAKELLGIDHRGILALDRFDSCYYMDITAEKIAALVAEVEK